MFKLKFYFPAKLLTVVLCILMSFDIFSKDLDFTTSSPCYSLTQEYEINFDNAGELEWIIEGGTIVSLDGRNTRYTPQEMFATYMGTQWYTNLSTGKNEPIDAANTYAYSRIKFNGNEKMSVTCFAVTSSGAHQFDGSDHRMGYPTLSSNPLKKITILWSDAAYVRTLTCKGSSLGVLGLESGNVKKTIQLYKAIPNFNINASINNLKCNQGIQLDGVPYDPAYYTTLWFAPNAAITQNWNSGIYIDHFNTTGIVPVYASVSNLCGETVIKTVNLVISQPDFGHVTQNGNNVDVSGTVVAPDCQGNFYLSIPVINNAIYTWELPGLIYNNQTNIYDRETLSGRNMGNISGQLPQGAYTDFIGKVTITGLCGEPVVKNFIVRPSLQPSVDQDIYSCSNSVVIKVNNPNGNSPINAWITTHPQNGWGSFVNGTSTSIAFTASTPGDYAITIQLTDANGCYKPLQTTVHAGKASNNTNASTAGWQSGVLSDNRVKPGSNLAFYNNKIYFAGRDGKIYFYSYSDALQKWIINQIPGIANASIPLTSNFNKIGIATLGTTAYLFYTDDAGFFMKVDLSAYNVSPGIVVTLLANDFVASGNDLYVIEKNTSVLKKINETNVINLASLPGTSLKTIIPGSGILYVQNNNLYGTGFSYPLTTSNDVYPSSDVAVYNGYVYFARGQKGAANLFRFPLNNTGAFEQITTTGNLSGVFTINPASGVIYYGILRGASNSIATVTSGGYKAADIYQAHQQNNAWVFNAATLVKPSEDFDMYIQSPVYGGNHVYYIGAGYNNQIGESYELEVWNLYYENACAPAIQRSATVADEENRVTEVSVYPNPFTNTLQLDLSGYTTKSGEQQAVFITVLDAAGREVYSIDFVSELFNINTGNWASGIYLIKITCNNKSVIKKAIKI